MSGNALAVQGDAIRLPIRSGSVGLVVTSPPYFGLRDYGTPGEIGAEATPDDYVAALRATLRELERVLVADGNVFLVIGDKYARRGGVDRKVRGAGSDPGGRRHLRPVQRGVPGVADGSLLGLPYRVALAAIADGWVWRQDIVWAKLNPLPESVRSRCVRAHETVIHLARTQRHYAAPVERGGGHGHDVWSIGVRGYRDPEGRRHPAVYPPELVSRIIDGWSRPEDVVLDPFVGSGTTLEVARQLGRAALGLDIHRDNAALATRRAQLERRVAG